MIQYATGRTGSYQAPHTVTVIDYEAFRWAAGLRTVTWGEKLQTIRDSAFADCPGLSTVTVPRTVTQLGEQAFARCTNLVGILFEGNAIRRNAGRNRGGCRLGAPGVGGGGTDAHPQRNRNSRGPELAGPGSAILPVRLAAVDFTMLNRF